MSLATTAEAQNTSKPLFGFWVYIMTDCVLFATLFATYAVLRNNTYGGPDAKELFSMPYVLAETLILLTSSFTAGLALLAVHAKKKSAMLVALVITFILGASFLSLELHEFNNLYQEGHSWRASAFLSAFFTLVGTHGLHITSGLIWLGALTAQFFKKGFTDAFTKRLTLFGMFWHFLDIVWIFIFTIVYLLGAVS